MSATPLAARLVAVMVAVVLAASVLTVSLDALKFRRVLRAQQDQIYLFAAQDLAGAIEDGMNLGLPLAAFQTADLLIQRRRTAEKGTMGITVFDSTGQVVFDTDRFRVGQKLPLGWGPALAGQAEWRGDLPRAYLVGARIVNNFGQPAGGVALRYDRTALEARMNAILLDMSRAALLAIAVTGVVGTAAATLLTRPYRNWFQHATAQLDAAGAGGTPVPGSEGVMQAIDQAAAALDSAEAALMRLGTGEAEPEAVPSPAHG